MRRKLELPVIQTIRVRLEISLLLVSELTIASEIIRKTTVFFMTVGGIKVS